MVELFTVASRSEHGHDHRESVPNPPAASATLEHQQQQVCLFIQAHAHLFFQIFADLLEIGANTEIIAKFVEEKVY